MSVRSKIKKNARKAMTQNYIRALSIMLIYTCVVFLFAIFMMGADAVAGLLHMPRGTFGLFSGIKLFEGWNYVFSPLVVATSLVLQFILLSPLVVGVARWFYRLVGGGESEILELFDYFSGARKYFGSIWLELNLAVRSFIVSFVFTAVPVAVFFIGGLLAAGQWPAGGIEGPVAALVGTLLLICGAVLFLLAAVFAWIFLKRYFLARYLYAEEGCGAWQAIQQSVYFMKGRKAELFVFDLSYLGWFLSLLAIIPAFYVLPYYASAKALYARYLIEYSRRYAQREGAQADGQPTREYGGAQGSQEEAPPPDGPGLDGGIGDTGAQE